MLTRAGFLLGALILAVITLGPGCGGEPDPNPGDGRRATKTAGKQEDFQPLLTIPGYDKEADDLLAEEIEITYLSFNMKGDAAGRVPKNLTEGVRLGSESSTTKYLLLYSNGWMKANTFGGPFESLAKKQGVETSWKEIRKMAYQDLYSFLWNRGFFELPGDRAVDWERFEGKDVFTKAISVNRGGDRWIVFLDDVTGERGDDPRWGVFRDCELKIVSWFSAINDIRPQVSKQGFGKAFEQFQRRDDDD